MDDKELIKILLNKYNSGDKSGIRYDFKSRTIWIEVFEEHNTFPLTRNELADEIGDKESDEIINWIRE